MGRPTNGMWVGYPSTCFPHLQKLFPRCSRYLHPPNTKFKMNHQTAKNKTGLDVIFPIDHGHFWWVLCQIEGCRWWISSTSLLSSCHWPLHRVPPSDRRATPRAEKSAVPAGRRIEFYGRIFPRELRVDQKILISMGVPRKYLGGFKKKTIAITVQWILTLYSNW